MDFTVQGGMKITTVLHAPGWHRTRLIRRAIAILLILVPAALALHSALKKDPQVVVAVRTIDAGSTVTAEDVALRRVPQNLLPEGTFDSTDDVVGHVAVAAISPNEIPSHRAVPVKLLIAFALSQTIQLVAWEKSSQKLCLLRGMKFV